MQQGDSLSWHRHDSMSYALLALGLPKGSAEACCACYMKSGMSCLFVHGPTATCCCPPSLPICQCYYVALYSVKVWLIFYSTCSLRFLKCDWHTWSGKIIGGTFSLVSNHQPVDCLFSRLFRRRSRTTSKPRVTGLCAVNSPVNVEFPAQMASDAENVSIWWRHHESCYSDCGLHICTYPIKLFSSGNLLFHHFSRPYVWTVIVNLVPDILFKLPAELNNVYDCCNLYAKFWVLPKIWRDIGHKTSATSHYHMLNWIYAKSPSIKR